jgi:branched-chain amino acid transport system ATP-binding protein
VSDFALETVRLSAGYGGGDVLHEVCIGVERHAVTAIVGPNGAGKSTLMKCLSGIHRFSSGSVRLFGEEIRRPEARAVLAAGLSLGPERRRIFPGMTVEENLLVGAVTVSPRMARRRVQSTYEQFPWLRDRRRSVAGNLSGGQQQILAICRAIMTAPQLLLLDEPSLGLSPVAIKDVADLIRALAETDMTILVVEQNVSLGLNLADRAYVLSQGRISREGAARELQQDSDLVAAYMG